jgi:hypothetical protein
VATKQPGLVFRNPEKVEQGWRQMREDRAEFVEFFGGDEVVLPPGQAEERLNAYYRQHQEAALARRPARRRPRNLPGLDVPAFEVPPGLADVDTIGIIFDETDGLAAVRRGDRGGSGAAVPGDAAELLTAIGA